MALPLYLAMTAAEMMAHLPLPAYFGYMACHFSPYGTSLSNLPATLPDGAMLILNDRIPLEGHDIGRIREELEAVIQTVHCGSLLLDFQRPGVTAVSELVRILTDSLPCPVGVSHGYAKCGNGPVFVPPVPPDVPVQAHLAPWEGREIWLESALDGCAITVTGQGCHRASLPYPSGKALHRDRKLHCHYDISLSEDQVVFTLLRTEEDLANLLEEAEKLGVTRAVGLWQELG